MLHVKLVFLNPYTFALDICIWSTVKIRHGIVLHCRVVYD